MGEQVDRARVSQARDGHVEEFFGGAGDVQRGPDPGAGLVGQRDPALVQDPVGDLRSTQAAPAAVPSGMPMRYFRPGRAGTCPESVTSPPIGCDGLPAALKVLRRSRDYIVMMSSLNSGPSLPGRRLAEAWHGR